MEEVTIVIPSNQKAVLKQKIRALEEEKSQLENEILSLKDKIEVVELERKSNSLASEIGTLQVEKTLLEEKVSSYYETPPDNPRDAADFVEATNSVHSEFEEVSTKLAEATAEIQAKQEVPEVVAEVVTPVQEETNSSTAVSETPVIESQSNSTPISS